MRTKVWLFVMGMVVAFLTGAGIAGADQGPGAGYSADATMETADGVIKGPVYSMPGMERREYVSENGDKTVMIVRHDQKVVWMVMPEDGFYMEMKIPEEGRRDDLGAYQIEQTTIGPETVNGVETTKSKVIMIGPNGEKMGGFAWATREGIFVKIDAIAVEKGSKERFKMELKNLKVGDQDAGLFEVPEGFTRMDLGGFGSAPGTAGKPSQGKSKKKGLGLKDALNPFK